MSDAAAMVQQGLGEAVLVALPLLAAAVGAGLVAGWLGARLGLSDPVASGVLRGLAVLGVLVLMAGELAERAQALAIDAWSELAEVGRGR